MVTTLVSLLAVRSGQRQPANAQAATATAETKATVRGLRTARRTVSVPQHANSIVCRCQCCKTVAAASTRAMQLPRAMSSQATLHPDIVLADARAVLVQHALSAQMLDSASHVRAQDGNHPREQLSVQAAGGFAAI